MTDIQGDPAKSKHEREQLTIRIGIIAAALVMGFMFSQARGCEEKHEYKRGYWHGVRDGGDPKDR